MDYEKTIRNLKKQLLAERIAFGFIAVIALIYFVAGSLGGGKSMIVVDGKPVVCVDSASDAQGILDQIKSDCGTDPMETEFKEDVRIARAPRNTSATPTSRAMTVARSAISPVINRWAVIADGKPVVGLPSKEAAAKTVEQAKIKFGSQAKQLAEEPQIKENVSIAKAAINPQQCQETPEQAVQYLFTSAKSEKTNAAYTVKPNDVAVTIARKLGLAPGELKKLNPGVNLDKLSVGDVLQVRQSTIPEHPLTIIVRDLVHRTEKIAPSMERVSSPQMFKGKVATISHGKAGKRIVDVVIIYENGKMIGQEIVSEQLISAPVAGKVAIGVKPRT